MASLADIRKQNPQYNALSDSELAERIYTKFYDGKIDRAEFYKRIDFTQPGPTKQAAGIEKPFGEGTVFERPNALTQGGDRDSIREIKNTPGNQITGALGNYVDAAMFGGADEALAGVHALTGGNFNQELARLEQARRDYNAVNNAQGNAATVGGIVGNPTNLMGGEFIAGGRSALTRGGRAAEIGGAMGGTGGFLGTEGNLQDRELGGLLGTGGGAALGLAGQPLMELLGLGLKKTGEASLGAVNTIRNQANARSDPTGQAERLLARSFMDDNVPLGYGPAPVNPPLPGQGAINIGGENVASLGRQATAAMGPTRAKAAEFFGEQASAAPDRAADALKGLSSKGYYGTLEALDKGREAAAAPLYKAAREKGSVGVWNDHLSELIKRPSLGSAWQRAKAIAGDRGDALPEIFTMDAAGNITGVKQVPDLKTWDYIKRGLDDVIADNKNSITGKIETDKGRGVVALKRELLDELDAQIPEYKAAREAYAGPSHSIEVVDQGRDFWKSKGDPADTIRAFKDMSAADKDYARIGIVREAMKDVGNTADAGSVYVKLFNTPNKRALLETAFPDRASFEKFATQMRAEKEMLATNRTVTGGSPTSRIDADKAALSEGNNVIDWVSALKSGNPLSILGMTLDKAKNLQRGLTPEVSTELGNLLFQMDPIEIQRIMSRVGSVRVPAPVSALSPGATMFLRNTPLAPLLGYGSGQAGAAIASRPGAR